MRAPLAALLLLLAAAPPAAASPVVLCEAEATNVSAHAWCATPAGDRDAHLHLCPPNARCLVIPLLACVVGVPGPAWCEVLP
ncbi:MAG TPA: hypothetical protein VNX21_08275 [Candidatus Thermoplasmatota archaeon]|nr:hypothetical protein [Candidatus Thermoplasmatota archaeon]